MNPRKRLQRILCAALLLLALGGLWWWSRERPERRKPVVLRDATFSGGLSLPGRVENLRGTALFNLGSELELRLGQLGGEAPGGVASFFVLLDPSDPRYGVLVRAAGNLSPGVLQRQPSRPVSLSGPVRTLEAPHLASHFQEAYGLQLARDPQGRLLWIDQEGAFQLENPREGTAEAVDPAMRIDFDRLDEEMEVQLQMEETRR